MSFPELSRFSEPGDDSDVQAYFQKKNLFRNDRSGEKGKQGSGDAEDRRRKELGRKMNRER